MSSSSSKFKPRPQAKPKPAPQSKPQLKQPKQEAHAETAPTSIPSIQYNLPSSSSASKSSSSNRGRRRQRNNAQTSTVGGGSGFAVPVGVIKTEPIEQDEGVGQSEEVVEDGLKAAPSSSMEVDEQMLDWAQIRDLWQGEDGLSPLTLPFVPETYKRVNTDMRQTFGTDGNNKEAQKVVLIQLPKYLPIKKSGEAISPVKAESTEASNTEVETKKETTNTSKNLFADIKPGKIGKLRIHESGRATLLLGDHLFEVSPGLNCSFYEEACSLDVSKKQFTSISNIHNRLICIPSVSHMLSEAKKKSANVDNSKGYMLEI